MGLFQFGRKIDTGKEFSLADIPIFSSLSTSEQSHVEKKARLTEYKRGDIVYDEGNESDAFYVVVSGRFRLFNRLRGDKGEQTLIFFYRGDHFGETSLLTGNLHSGTVEAKSDSLILKFDKKDFLKLVNDIPGISLHLSRSLGHRLTLGQGGRGHRREVKITAFYTKVPGPRPTALWIDIVKGLMTQSRRNAVMLDLVPFQDSVIGEQFGSGIPSFSIEDADSNRETDVKSKLIEHPSGFHYLRVSIANPGEIEEKKLSQLLTFLTYKYDYLFVRLPTEIIHTGFHSLKHSDLVYVYSESDSDSLASCRELLEEFEKGFGFSRNEIKILIPEDQEDLRETAFEDKELFLGQRIFSLIPDKEIKAERYDSVIRYLAKDLTGNLVGLALGSGAAYGLSHIGVIKALERENIPIDVVAGSSMGALVGAIWAAGYGSEDLERIAGTIDKKRGFFRVLGFRDVSIAHQGFFKGNQLCRFLKPYLGGKTFQDMKKQLRIVATNMFTAEEVVFRAGPVVDAVRASVSIPGIFRPMSYKGQFLIDGGVIDPLPVRVLSQLSVKKIIAVNVLPSPKDWAAKYQMHLDSSRKRDELMTYQKFWGKIFRQSTDHFKRRYSGNIFNAIMNTIQFLEYEMSQNSGMKADVLIHPICREAHWAQFYYPKKFIKAGEDAAMELMPEIRRLLSE